MSVTFPAYVLAARTGWRALLPETEKLGEIGLRLLVTLIAAFLAQRVLFLAVARLENVVRRAGRESEASRQRASTVGQVLRNLVTILVVGFAFVHALAVLGWDVKPILAGAGILGVALGFGAQTLVRDVIAGFFILAEDQFSVGDLIEAGGKPATVEAITLRSTTLRDFNGYVHFVPNGEMKVVTNRSRGWQRLAVDVPVATDQDLDRALKLCREVAESMNRDPHWQEQLLDPIDLWGVENLGPTEASLRLVVRAAPGPGAPQAARELRQRTHRALMLAGLRTSMSRDITMTPIPGGGITPETVVARAAGTEGGES